MRRFAHHSSGLFAACQVNPRRQFDVEDRTPTLRIAESHLSAKPVDDFLDDAKAKAAAALAPRIRRIGPMRPIGPPNGSGSDSPELLKYRSDSVPREAM